MPLARSRFDGDLNYNSTAFDLMGRFSKGVRPLKSSFGIAARYFDFNITGGDLGNIAPQLLGAGLFWHTAPLGLIDGAVNTIPFFRYPKWMEVSFYIYPIAMAADHAIPLAFSVNTRGRLIFTKDWFLDLSLNYHHVSVKKLDFDAAMSLVEGSLGLGYNF